MAVIFPTERLAARASHSDVLLVPYVRRSSHRQKSGHGKQRQLVETNPQGYADRRGWVLYPQPYIDDGVSGFTGANWTGELGRFLKDYHSGVFGSAEVALGIEDIHRFSRQHPEDALSAFVEDFLKSGITISLLNRDKDYTYENYRSNCISHIELYLLMKEAHEESVRKRYFQSSNTAKWRRQIEAATEGESDKKIVYGRLPGWLSKKGDEIVFNEHAETVRKICDLMKTMGCPSVTRYLNDNGIPTIRGESGTQRQWYTSSVSSLVSNPALYGALRIAEPGHNERVQEWRRICIDKRRRGVPESELPPKPERTFLPLVEDYYPAVVTREEYDYLHSVIDGRRQAKRGRTDKMLWFGQGLTRCICGAYCSATPFKRTIGSKVYAYTYMRCFSQVNRRDSARCQAPTIRMDDLQRHVLGRLRVENIALLFQGQHGRERQARLEEAMAKRDACFEELEAAKARYKKNEDALLRIDEDSPEWGVRLERQVGLRRLIAELEVSYREFSSGVRQLSYADRPEAHGGELMRLTRQWFNLFLAGRDSAEMRKQLNQLLNRLRIQIVVDSAQRLVGIGMGDSPLDWAPLDDEVTRRALSDGLVGHSYYTQSGDGVDLALFGEREPVSVDGEQGEMDSILPLSA